MAEQLFEFFSSKEELQNMIDTAESALNFVKEHLNDIVTVAQTAKEAYETAKQVYETAKNVSGKIPVSPAVIVAALTALILRRRP